MKYDVIIVGAGTGGALASKTLAKLGLKTCLLDRKRADLVGNKICGDGVEQPDMDELHIPLPKGDAIENRFESVKFHAPDTSICLPLKRKGYVVDRLKFGQHFLKGALDAGTEFCAEVMVRAPLTSHGTVIGVEAKDIKTGEKIEIEGRIVIDASGVHSPLRKAMRSPYIESEIATEDVWVCYRTIIRFGGMDWDRHTLYNYISHDQASREYWWFFPKGENRANLGVCVRGTVAHGVRERYADYYKHEILPKIQEPVEVIHQGGGIVSTRRPLWSMVESGIMFVGDAACLPNAVHGGGIGQSMRSGIYAAEVATDAIERGDYSIDGLWEYNKRYARDQGGASTNIELVRILFERFLDDELNFVFRNRLVTGRDILNLLDGKGLRLTSLEIAARALQGAARPDLVSDLLLINTKIERILRLYRGYPDRAGFDRWKQSVEKVFEKTRRLIRRRASTA